MKVEFILDRRHRMAETEAKLRRAMKYRRDTYDSLPRGPLCDGWDTRTGRPKPSGGCTHSSCFRIVTGGLL